MKKLIAKAQNPRTHIDIVKAIFQSIKHEDGLSAWDVLEQAKAYDKKISEETNKKETNSHSHSEAGETDQDHSGKSHS